MFADRQQPAIGIELELPSRGPAPSIALCILVNNAVGCTLRAKHAITGAHESEMTTIGLPYIEFCLVSMDRCLVAMPPSGTEYARMCCGIAVVVTNESHPELAGQRTQIRLGLIFVAGYDMNWISHR